jgi:hypothetical protein
MSNVATGDDLMYDGGGGLYIDGSQAVVRNNTIEGNNGRSRGGGLYIYQSIVTMRGNTVVDNDAALYGGGLYMVMSSAALEANTITGNEASQYGGGLIFGGCAPFTLTNNIIAQNSVQGSGPALYIARFQETPWSTPYPSRGRLLHNTLVDNNSSAVPWMIHVGPSTTLAFTNTIIDKPGGITVAAGSAVFLDTTLWSPSLLLQPGLTVSGTGSIISATNYYSATGIVLPTYHLAPTSAAIDLGVDAGVTVDIDGDSRPQGAGYDIGADEHRWRTHLPLFLRDTP